MEAECNDSETKESWCRALFFQGIQQLLVGKRMVEGPTTVIAKTTMLICSEMPRVLRVLRNIVSIDFSKKYHWNMLLHRTLPPIIVVAEPLWVDEGEEGEVCEGSRRHQSTSPRTSCP